MNITLSNGDSALIKPIITVVWHYIIPAINGEIISYAVTEERDTNTLLLFASRDLGTRKLVPNLLSMEEVSKDVANFVEEWLSKEEKPVKPPPQFGGSVFKGFWLSTEGLPHYEGTWPILAIRPTWIFYPQ